MSSSATIRIPFDGSGQITVGLHSVDGRSVEADYNVVGSKVTLHRATLPSGLYVCTISAEDRVIGSAKLAVVD